MNAVIATAAGAAPANLLGSHSVTAPGGTDPLRFYRRVFYLRFPTGGLAERIALQEGIRLQGRFAPLDFDALHPPAGLPPALLTSAAGGVRVELKAPLEVRQVQLGFRRAGVDALEFYRLDGETPSAAPTLTATRGNPRLLREVTAGVSRFGSEGRAVAPVETVRAEARGLELPGAFEAGFTDARFLLRLKPPDPPALAPADLTALQIRSYPSAPRLRLVAPDDPGLQSGGPVSGGPFWQAGGQVGATVPEADGVVDAGKALEAELKRYLDRLRSAGGTPLPPSVEVALVIESDAPCRFTLSQLQVPYSLVIESLPGGAAKQLLRFDGTREARQELVLNLPAAAQVRSARLRTTESFGGGRLAGETDGLAEHRSGVRVEPERWIAQPLNSLPGSVVGVSLALLALAPGTRVVVELQTGSPAGPSGKSLGTAALELGPPGTRGWAVARFQPPVALEGEPGWLLVSAAAGQATWLTTGGAAALRVLGRAAPQAPWEEQGALAGREGLYRLVSRGEESVGVPLTVAVEGKPVLPEPAEEDARVYNLTPAVPANRATDRLTLTFTSAVEGFLTAYPPLIEYDLP